ncbi:hypothetical protein ILYODFUR_015538 [Ilyodon furcidens]|uniref:Uncharacterized protein n=1 Tax=Ilyodon furcidens TaxID=33524 RepID=A0ABV0TWG9_9TELE
MLPASLHSGVLCCTYLDRMLPPNMDLADSRQESTRDCWVQQQMKETMKHLPADLEVLPSPLLLEQMEREAVQRPSPSSLVARPDPAAKPSSFSRSRKCRRGAFPCLSAGEEESPMATAVMTGAVVSLPTDVKAAASNPASSSATALSAKLAAPLPKPSSHISSPRFCGDARRDGGAVKVLCSPDKELQKDLSTVFLSRA